MHISAVASTLLDDAGLSPSSRRAYLADLADIVAWCAERQIPDISQLRALDAFIYLVEQRKSGRSPATVRRRRTLFRKLIGAGAVAIEPGEFAAIEERLQNVADDATAVLVVSDDAIIRAGLRAVLTESRAVCWTEKSGSIAQAASRFWDYVIVWINSPSGLDPYGPLRHIDGLAPVLTTHSPIVAVHTGRLGPMVQLRLAEAGVRYAVPHSWLSAHLQMLAGMLSTASVPLQFHLDTALALRQQLGLLLHGSLAELLRAAADVPDIVWTGHLPQSHLPISRSRVNALRQIARERAGVPGPDFSKYATSVRRMPETPEWPRVRDVVRQALEVDA